MFELFIDCGIATQTCRGRYDFLQAGVYNSRGTLRRNAFKNYKLVSGVRPDVHPPFFAFGFIWGLTEIVLVNL